MPNHGINAHCGSSSYNMEHFPFFFPNIFESMPPLFISSLPATRVGSTSAKCSSSCNTSDASNRRSLSALQDESMICSRPLQHRDHCTADQSDLDKSLIPTDSCVSVCVCVSRHARHFRLVMSLHSRVANPHLPDLGPLDSVQVWSSLIIGVERIQMHVIPSWW